MAGQQIKNPGTLEGARSSASFPAQDPKIDTLVTHIRTNLNKSVVVVGGGISGLSAALRLAERGFHVTVLEGQGHVGGMAYAQKGNNSVVENGNHAFFGSGVEYYANVVGLCKELGTYEHLHHVPEWTIANGDGTLATMKNVSWLPTGYNAAPSILKMPWLSFFDKLQAMWGAHSLIQKRYSEYEGFDRSTGFELGRKMGYSENGLFTLNSATFGLTCQYVTELSGALFAGVNRVMLGAKEGLTYLVPTRDLTDILGNPLKDRLASMGGEVITQAQVTAMTPSKNGSPTVVTYQTSTGTTTLNVDYVIVATQPWDAKKLLPWVEAQWTELGPISPVISMNIGLSDRIKALSGGYQIGLSRRNWQFTVLQDLVHWWPEYQAPEFKNKSIVHIELGHTPLHHPGYSDDDIVSRVKKDLDRLFPEVKGYKIEFADLLREYQNLYVRWVSGEFAKKPKPSDLEVAPGMFLAGDWTGKGTIGMEAATISGYTAANFVLRAEGMPELQFPDIPIS